MTEGYFPTSNASRTFPACPPCAVTRIREEQAPRDRPGRPASIDPPFALTWFTVSNSRAVS